MPKNIFSKIALLFIIVIISNTVMAQKKSKTSTFKPPVVKSSIGGIHGIKDSINILTTQSIVDSAIKVVDAKGTNYRITHYQFVFKRIGAVENDSTGKVTATSDLAAGEFTSTPLTPIWRKTIKETAVAGEELYFTDIIVTDAKGHVFYAPEIRIGIK